MTFDPTTGLPVQTNAATPNALTLNLNNPVPPAPPGERTFTAKEIEDFVNAERERVRKEEKDKVYPFIETLQASVADLTRERDERLAAETLAQQAAAEAERLRQEAEMTSAERIEQALLAQNERFAAIEADRDRERALREREGEYHRVNQYRLQRLSEAADDILPQLVPYVQGNNEAEIDASIETSKQKSAEIFTEAQSRFGTGSRPRPPVGLPMSGAPAFDPSELTGGTQQQTITAQDIRDMDLSTFAANRDLLLRAASDHVRDVGVYGDR